MSKSAPAVEAVETSVEITLQEFCTRLSETLRRPELIGAFEFVERNADGGIHHICYEVDDILAARDELIRKGARILGSGEPRTGAHGKPVLFLHPKDFCGTLVELEQA